MKNKIAGAAMAFAALASAQGAAAQQACVQSEDISDTVTYAVPMIYDSVKSPCSNIFSASPFMTNEADGFVQKFRERQSASWPGTLRLLKVFMASQAAKDGGDASGMLDAFALLPEDSLRPLVDVVLGQLIDERLAKNIKVSTCTDISEAMELVAPLPPENIGGLTSFIARQVDLEEPSVCGVQPTTSE